MKIVRNDHNTIKVNTDIEDEALIATFLVRKVSELLDAGKKVPLEVLDDLLRRLENR
jgi:hypothetical protein